MIPVYASKFLSKLNPDEREIARKGGIVPVNDVFFDYYDKTYRHEIYYGGRGSGKSKFIASKLIRKCIQDKYFKYQYSRKHQVDIKESQFDLLKSTVRAMGKYSEFTFNESTFRVTHKPTGNCFIAKGMDDPEKSKGIDEINGFWGEEITEFDMEDIIGVNQNLRTEAAPLNAIYSFNPIHEENWVRSYFFEKDNAHKLKPEFTNAIALRTTLWDNHFINREAYANELTVGACGNENIIRVVLTGDWGQTENGNPWLYSLDTKKHFKDVPFLPGYPIYISFDFNNDPFACTIRQSSPQLGLPNSFVHYIDEIVGQLKIEDTCNIIKARYPSSIIYITGDRSGNNEDLGRNQTLYQMIAGMLGLNKKQVLTNSSNLLHSESRLLCNVMFEHHPNIYIGPKCVQLRKDCEKATVDAEHRLPSQLKKDREHFKMDTFDAMRYDFQTHFNDWAKNIYSKLIKR